jgi:hypothetical protein
MLVRIVRHVADWLKKAQAGRKPEVSDHTSPAEIHNPKERLIRRILPKACRLKTEW